LLNSTATGGKESQEDTALGRACADAAERRASAAPLAGVGSVEDGGTRQVPGNARAADPWKAMDFGRRERLEIAGCWVANRPERFAG